MNPQCICGHDRYKSRNYRNQDYDFQVLTCEKCGLSRTWPVPVTEAEADSFYNARDDYKLRNEETDSWRHYAKKGLARIKRHKNTGRLLEVGCNLGIFVDEALKSGYDAYGIDISHPSIEFGRSVLGLGERISVGDLASAGLKAESFDVVAYIHTMEHITDVNAELKRAYEILRPGGVLVVEGPNYESLWRILLGSRWYGFVPKQHIWQFGRKTLAAIIERSGFTPVKSYARGSLDHALTLNFKGAAKLAILFAAYILNWGDNLTIVAYKKPD